MNKLEMAHDWYMKHAYQTTHEKALAKAWQYADAMQAEADKRDKAEAEQKRKEMRELLNAENTFIEREGQHFDDVEWQPDWSQAPDWAEWWAMDEDCARYFYLHEPTVLESEKCWKWNKTNEHDEDEDSMSGDYYSNGYTGRWQDSLRKRQKGGFKRYYGDGLECAR